MQKICVRENELSCERSADLTSRSAHGMRSLCIISRPDATFPLMSDINLKANDTMWHFYYARERGDIVPTSARE